MTSGISYFPIIVPANSVVGRLSSTAGITEAIPFAQLAVALGVGGSTYLLATNIAGTNTITGTTATAPLLVANQVVFLIPANTNTGAVTFDRDAQSTPKSVFYNGAALVGGEIAAGVPSVWFYDGTQYNIIANGIAAGNAAARGTVASATTTNLDTSSSLTQQITGTTTITGITLANGHVRIVVFAGILTLTNGASLILGGSNIVTAAGDVAIFVGEPSGVTRLAAFARASGAKQPTRTVLTSGTSATYTTPAGATRINVRMVGGGGGGGGATSNNGAAGNQTTFSTLTAGGGGAGQANGGQGGTAGTASGGDINIPGGGGGAGSVNATAGVAPASGGGGNSVFGGGGPSSLNATGGAGATNSGGGGAGGGAASSTNSGGGGGAGGYVEKLIISPAATYTYTVGATAAGGIAGGTAGGVGAAGIIIVDEMYN